MSKEDMKKNDEKVVSDDNIETNDKKIEEDGANQSVDIEDIEKDASNNSENDESYEYEEDNINESEKSPEELLKEEADKLRDEKLRLLAEMENLRKRSDKERIDSIRYGSVNLARDILSPDDNLTRALEAIPKEEEKSETVINLIDGLKMVQKEFSNILEKYGVKKIEALNTKFDHNFHQAMVELENDDVEEGTVIQEMQKGYMMHERLLRPSMVGVSKKSTSKNDDKKD